MRTPDWYSRGSGWIVGATLTTLFLFGCNLLTPSKLPAKDAQPPSIGNQPLPAAPAFDLAAGLGRLTSYHFEYLQTDRGTLNGQPYQASFKLSRSILSQPESEDSIIDNHLPDGSTFYLQLIRTGGAVYLQKASGAPCQGSLDTQPSGEIPNPAELLPTISSAEKLGKETLDGLAVTHYRFDGQALGLRLGNASGEMWLSGQDGLVVKFQLDILPPEKRVGKGLEVRRKIQYELNDINTLHPVGLPAACMPVLVDIPALPDAAGVERRSAWMSFTTPSSPSQAAAFYAQSLPPLGWTFALAGKGGSPTNTSPENGLVYRKDQQTLSITFIQGESGLNVAVMLLDPAFQLPEAAQGATSTPLASTPQAGVGEPPVSTPTFDRTQSGLPEDVPLYPGAAAIQTFSGKGLTFLTSDSGDQIASFYSDRLKSAGWQPVHQTRAGTIISQTWIKGKTTLNINIQDQTDHRTVMIIATKIS